MIVFLLQLQPLAFMDLLLQVVSQSKGLKSISSLDHLTQRKTNMSLPGQWRSCIHSQCSLSSPQPLGFKLPKEQTTAHSLAVYFCHEDKIEIIIHIQKQIRINIHMHIHTYYTHIIQHKSKCAKCQLFSSWTK